MFINSEKLSIEEKKLKSLIEKYNDIILNYYNSVSESSVYWNSTLSVRFYSDVDNEKAKLKLSIEELKSLDFIYSYMIESYSMFGKKIEYDINNQEKLISCFNKYVEKYDYILKLYRNIENSFDNKEYIMHQIEKIEDNKNILLELKENYIDIFDKLKEIDAEIKNRITSLNIDFIKETEFQQYL